MKYKIEFAFFFEAENYEDAAERMFELQNMLKIPLDMSGSFKVGKEV